MGPPAGCSYLASASIAIIPLPQLPRLTDTERNSHRCSDLVWFCGTLSWSTRTARLLLCCRPAQTWCLHVLMPCFDDHLLHTALYCANFWGFKHGSTWIKVKAPQAVHYWHRLFKTLVGLSLVFSYAQATASLSRQVTDFF